MVDTEGVDDDVHLSALVAFHGVDYNSVCHSRFFQSVADFCDLTAVACDHAYCHLVIGNAVLFPQFHTCFHNLCHNVSLAIVGLAAIAS